MPRLIGAHMPAAGGLHKAIRNAHAIGCTAIQVFTSSPQQWKGKVITDELADQFQHAVKETKMKALISHDCYLVNLAAPSEEIREKSVHALTGEMERCARLEIPVVVSHLGSHMGLGEEEGIRRVATHVKRILKQTPKDIYLAMETTAGQGTNLFFCFEQMGQLLDALDGDSRLCVCLDTCHVFAAGYDIRDKKSFDAAIRKFDKVVGLERLRCIHANDSKFPLGSRRDRHEHIGNGQIGLEAFRLFVNDRRLSHAPIVIETPDAETMHATNIKTLLSLLKK
jgi:deoxyribonuclease-4